MLAPAKSNIGSGPTEPQPQFKIAFPASLLDESQFFSSLQLLSLLSI